MKWLIIINDDGFSPLLPLYVLRTLRTVTTRLNFERQSTRDTFVLISVWCGVRMQI